MLWKIIIGNQQISSKKKDQTRFKYCSEMMPVQHNEKKMEFTPMALDPSCFERYLDIPTFIRQGRRLTADTSFCPNIS